MLQHNTKNSKALSDCVSVVVTLAAEGGPDVITDEQQLHTCRELATIVHSAVIACSTETVPVSALVKLLYVTGQPQLLQEAVTYVKTRPEQYRVVDKPQQPAMWYYTAQPKKEVESSLAAAVLKLSSWLGAKVQECRPFMELLEVCITALTAKTSAVIPDTWAVKFSFTPCCKDCRDLAQFLSNSSQEVGRFKVAGARRTHLQQKLIGVSASCAIERSSQMMVVTKTRPHLQQEREQQKKALQVLASLRALPAAASIAMTTNGATASTAPPTTHSTHLKKGPVVDLTTA